MGTLTFNGESFESSWTPPYGWTTLAGAWQYGWLDGTFDGVNSEDAVDFGFAQTVDDTEITSAVLITASIDWPEHDNDTEAGICIIDATRTGFSAFLTVGNQLVVRKEVSGSAGTTLTSVSGLSIIGTPELAVSFDVSTGEISVSLNDDEIATASYTDVDEGLKAGFQQYHSGPRSSANFVQIETQFGASATINTLGDDNTTVRVGSTHPVTTTGLGTLTTASTIGGKAIASADAPDGDGTITLAGFTAGQTYPAMGTVTCIMTDDTLSASVNRVLDTMPGWQWVTVAGLDRGEWSLGKAFAEDETPEQLHVIDDGVGILNPDGTLTEWPDTGTFGAWARMAAGGPYSVGEMVYFTFTVNSGGIVTGGSIVNFGTVSYGTVKYGIAE